MRGLLCPYSPGRLAGLHTPQPPGLECREPMPIQRFTDYDPFAWIYDTHWGGDYHAQAYEVLQRLLLRHLDPGARILDLCCGGGHVTADLVNHGWDVMGLDGSEEMLAHARR